MISNETIARQVSLAGMSDELVPSTNGGGGESDGDDDDDDDSAPISVALRQDEE